MYANHKYSTDKNCRHESYDNNSSIMQYIDHVFLVISSLNQQTGYKHHNVGSKSKFIKKATICNKQIWNLKVMFTQVQIHNEYYVHTHFG